MMHHAISLPLDGPDHRRFANQALALGTWLVGLRFFWFGAGVFLGVCGGVLMS